MKTNTKCKICGRFFIPHKNVGCRQKVCFRGSCKKAVKKINQKVWLDKNPEYFKGRYEYLKTWRAKNPKYQRNQRRNNKSEIQDLVLTNSSKILMGFAIVAHFSKIEIQDLVRHSFCCCSRFHGDG